MQVEFLEKHMSLLPTEEHPLSSVLEEAPCERNVTVPLAFIAKRKKNSCSCFLEDFVHPHPSISPPCNCRLIIIIGVLQTLVL